MPVKTDMKWQDYASCNGIEDYYKIEDTPSGDPMRVKHSGTNLFFDDYESDAVTAMNTDQMCFHCPVARQCLEDGEDSGSWGVHGGVYLVYGKIDIQRNSHKSADDWKELSEIHGYDLNEGDS